MSIVGAFMVPHPPLIIPEVGQGQERIIQKTVAAYQKVAKQIARLKPDTIVLTSPHTTVYADYFHISPGISGQGDFGPFGAADVQIDVPYDRKFIKKLVQVSGENDFEAGTQGELEKKLDHATMVPLYFVNQVYDTYKLVRIGLSGQSLQKHYKLGEYIKSVSEQMNRRVVFIASGDLSHKLKEDGPYGYQKEGPVYDEKIMNVMASGTFLELFHFDTSFCEKAAECGHNSFVIMAGALDRTSIQAKKLSYEGSFGVGYGICSYQVNGTDESRDFGEQFKKESRKVVDKRKSKEDAYVRLARLALESYVKNKKIIDVPEDVLDEMLHMKAGTFVSIKMGGKLRGCIGTIASTKDSVAEEIIHNAISSAVHDPRFNPVSEKELLGLVYSVDVLGETEPIVYKDQLDVKRYGVIVTKGNRRGLLLPNLDGVQTVEEQIEIATQKAGIREGETVSLERFEVIRHV